jgi:SAM-dependent methyltransferase
LANKGKIRLLDVGCGTGIFPSYLDQSLPVDLTLNADLLDISASSLQEARRVLDGLEHFEVGEAYQTQIEDIPAAVRDKEYDLIWAIHSFTTVDVNKMEAVYRHLIDLLAPSGLFYIYQLAAGSSYQKLHGRYLRQHPNGKSQARYMQFEDSAEILNALGVKYSVTPLAFDHEIPEDRTDLLEKYLQKCILDDEVDVLDFFAGMLQEFHDRENGLYKIPQQVNLIEIMKQGL